MKSYLICSPNIERFNVAFLPRKGLIRFVHGLQLYKVKVGLTSKTVFKVNFLQI